MLSLFLSNALENENLEDIGKVKRKDQRLMIESVYRDDEKMWYSISNIPSSEV